MSLQQKNNIIVGIDPGTVVTGYGVIWIDNNQYKAQDFGVIKTAANLDLNDRYHYIYKGVVEIIKKYRPAYMAIETQFMSKNPQSALKLGMARGVVIIAAKEGGLPIFGYTPKEAKKAVVGNGSASKEQVQAMVQMLLGLAQKVSPADAADALALAICHANTIRHKR